MIWRVLSRKNVEHYVLWYLCWKHRDKKKSQPILAVCVCVGQRKCCIEAYKNPCQAVAGCIKTENALFVKPEGVRKYLSMKEKQVVVVTAAAISWQEDRGEEALAVIFKRKRKSQERKRREERRKMLTKPFRNIRIFHVDTYFFLYRLRGCTAREYRVK